MAKYRMIKTEFWDDDYIYELPTEAKLLFLFLCTNDKVNLSGIYRVSIPYICRMTRLTKEYVEDLFKHFEKIDKMKYKDGWLSIKNFTKHQTASPKITEGIKREVAQIPQAVAKWAYPIHRLSYGTINLNSNFNLNSNLTLTSKDDLKEKKINKKKKVCPYCKIVGDSPSCYYREYHE